ncbi:MAG: DUF4374 domain-containing protein, partial [Prevotella sp.]
MKKRTIKNYRNMTKRHLLFGAALLCTGFALTACSDDDNVTEENATELTTPGNYVLSAKVSSGSGDVNYILTAESIDGGEITTQNNGLEAATGTEWVFYKDKYLYRLQYNQGESGTTESYCRNANGNVVKRDLEYT